MTGNQTYTIQDWETIIRHYARVGIKNSTDLGEYYRRYLLITRYLIGKGQLSTQEQSWSFFTGMQPHFEKEVRLRLRHKFVNHFPDDPYSLKDIYKAVSFILLGAIASGMQAPNPLAITNTDASSAKIEALATAVSGLSEIVKNVLQMQQVGVSKPKPMGAAAAGTNSTRTGICNFCEVPGHFIQECKIVEKYTQFGKCKRSPEGKVVLPSGAMVPQSIQGAWLRNQVDKWHQQNPGQMAAQMYIEVTTAPTATVPRNDTADQSYYSHPTTSKNQAPKALPAGVYALR